MEKEVEDAFVYIETVLRAFYESGRSHVLIIDELQVIGDMKIDGHLIYKLFNFFVRLTKELHLAHVFVISSDSLFIELVCSEAMLKGRCRYLLVDDFDYETTAAFLKGHGFTDEDIRVTWEYCGGKPVCLVELINSRNREEKAKEMFTFRTGELETRLKLVKELGDEIIIGSKRCDMHYEKLVSTLKMFVSREEIGMNEVDEVSKRYLVKENILFVDPLTAMIKPQSQLDLFAIRKVVGIA
ncbi:MAG: putative ATP-binding protein [Candidatus Methanogaster sp.]|nr:MAG: putative ATP-binding protein [ANME-2 cluster archaeon]